MGTEPGIDPSSGAEERSLRKGYKARITTRARCSTAERPICSRPPSSVNPPAFPLQQNPRSFLKISSTLDDEVWQEDNRTSSLSDQFRTLNSHSTQLSSSPPTDLPLRRMEAILPRLCRSQTNSKGRVPKLSSAFNPHLTLWIGQNRLKGMERQGRERLPGFLGTGAGQDIRISAGEGSPLI
jgi:hypothetical protein